MTTRNFSLKAVALISALITMMACQKEHNENPDPTPPAGTTYAMGWNGQDNPDEIPSNIFLGMGNASLPSSYSIKTRLPPVGDQEQYGTCVTWAVGYNLKTTLNAIDKNWSASTLADARNQTSPKDLFLAIPAADKGSGCNGTSFEPAFKQLINRGGASVSSVPYTNMGNCSQSPDAGASAEAGNNKLSNFRKISMDVAEIKTYISQNRPVVFGAKLSDNFMTWRGDQVLTSHSSFTNVGQHARHAMMITGYDDNKGPNGAFQVINSWGNVWGDKGFIWIDYNFMINPQFGMMAFVATNAVSDDYNPVDPPDENVTGNYDLVPWNVEDVSNGSGNSKKRKMYYNVYNTGTQSISASNRWNIVYLYYNAFDANDFGILLYDEYTDRYGSLGDNGSLENGIGQAGNWWNNINLPGGTGIAEVLYDDDRIQWTYTMPNINGYYYLVCLADAFDVIKESDEANNYYFVTDPVGWPLKIQNGVISGRVAGKMQDGPAPASGRKIDAVTPKDLTGNNNMYTPREIGGMIKTLKQNGKLKEAIQQFTSERGKAE
ncbi:MAG: C1 family peptidase [Chitinophagaceae bacterium]|nr:C1 family peptidase [Chitinophagaceae bacterium]